MEEITEHKQPETPPEEGVPGWLCVIGAGLCLFCTFGFLTAIGIFQTTYEQTTLSHYSPSTISWIFATQLCLMWAPGPLFGRITDTYGPGPILYSCSILCVFSLCMTSLSKQYYQIFLAQGIGFGIGAGGVFTTAVVCVGQWFLRRRGLAIGIASACVSLGGVIFPIFFNRVMEIVGFYRAVRYAALFISILLAASCFLVQARLPRKNWNPEIKWFDVDLFKEKEFALYTIGAFFVMLGLWAPYNYLPSMALEAGFSPTMSLYLISIINSTSIFGRIIPPHLGDTFGHFNVITVVAFLTGALILCLWLPFGIHHSQTGIVVFCLLYGFVSGAYVCLLMPCAAKTGSIETLGRRFGTFQVVMAISNLVGLPTLGAILNTQGNHDFMGLQLFAGVSVLIGTVLTIGSTYLLVKAQKSWRV
ncbi:major facilitator superfamily domain-containing protein [Lipomyces kononenkoae]|uniref:Major facilitator superfamily domain-containing protein n=1 Tax=Lipomyces kononenkoae TaxID=34357 RepID=A0ACC3SRG0_LIPKO